MQTSPTLAQKIAANRLDRAYRAPAAAPAATEDDLVDSTKLFSSNTWAEDTGKVKNPVTTLKSSLTKCMSFLPRGTKEPLPTGGTILQVGQSFCDDCVWDTDNGHVSEPAPEIQREAARRGGVREGGSPPWRIASASGNAEAADYLRRPPLRRQNVVAMQGIATPSVSDETAEETKEASKAAAITELGELFGELHGPAKVRRALWPEEFHPPVTGGRPIQWHPSHFPDLAIGY